VPKCFAISGEHKSKLNPKTGPKWPRSSQSEELTAGRIIASPFFAVVDISVCYHGTT